MGRGGGVPYEPKDYKDYSDGPGDGRPDVAIHKRGGLWVGDVKVKDPLGSRPAAVDARGAYVAFGDTAPGARLEVLGLEQRGQPSDPPFSRLTGAGYVAPVTAPYDRARRNGVAVAPLLFETFLGWGPGGGGAVTGGSGDEGQQSTWVRVRRDDVVGTYVDGLHRAARVVRARARGRVGAGLGNGADARARRARRRLSGSRARSRRTEREGARVGVGVRAEVRTRTAYGTGCWTLSGPGACVEIEITGLP